MSQVVPRGRNPAGSQRGGAAGKEDNLSGLLALKPEDKAGIGILIVDDERSLCETCSSILELEGYRVSVCHRGSEALDRLRQRAYDIVLIDLYMSQVPGMELLRVCLEKNPETIAIIITGNPSVDSSLEALRTGAWDYLPKPFAASHLQVLVGRAAHAVLVARETRALDAELEQRHGHGDKIKVLGSSPALNKVLSLCRKVARTDASVFITGESGSGKEMIAQFIHHHSRRSSRAMMAVNCAALPEPLLESEMFGHCKGAFTGAVQEKPGLLEAANGGTMFLDELTEMPLSIQAKLLRVIQDGVVRRVGSTSTDAVVNVRFIAATNRDPEGATEEGLLRRDLYYRLRVVPIRVPPLRERLEDIPILAQHFLAYYWSRHRELGAPLPSLTPEAIRALQIRPWHGNVRELQNTMEHTVVLLEAGAEVRPEDLPFADGLSSMVEPAGVPADDLLDEKYHVARDRWIAEFEQRYVTRLIDRADGNMAKAARLAGVDRTTLYRLMEKHGLKRETFLARA